MTRFLLEYGADATSPNETGATTAGMLWLQALAGLLGREGTCEVKMLLKDYAHTEPRRFNQIHKIVLGLIPKDLQTELNFLTSGINCEDSTGRTPLFWATMRNDSALVETRLAFGADANVVDRAGLSPSAYTQNGDV